MNSNYLTYTPEDLAADDQFILWAKAGKPTSSPWAQWLMNHPEVVPNVDKAFEIISALQYSEKVIPQSKTDALWERINNTIAEHEETKVVAMPRRNIFRLIAYAAAACLAILFASKLLLDNNENIYAGPAERIAHVLPDESKIQLNADSKIRYNKKAWASERTLSLVGEAYFEVEKGQKFIVKTKSGDVTVLGTSFNVYNREDGFRVQCTSGKVQVTSGDAKVILTPDSGTSLINGQLYKEELKQGKDIDWLNKIYRFDAIPLKVVFESVQRQFDVKVTMTEEISKRLYTGTFEATDLNKALNSICFPMELSPIVQGNKIRIELDADN